MFRDRMTLKRCAACLLASAFVLAGGAAPARGQKQRQKTPPKYTVPADSTVRLRLNEKLSSKDAKVGGAFTSTVVTPVHVRGVEIIPAGSIVAGSVTQVERAGRKGQAGSLGVTFTSLKLPNGERHPINASLAASDGEGEEGEVKGKSARKRNARFIGRGMVVGGIMSGGSGVVTGGLMGTARGLIKKGEEAEIDSGTEFDVVLNRGVSLKAYR